MTTQVIFEPRGEYVIADASNSALPRWPVQDCEARWHHEQFPGQRVSFSPRNVEFGIAVREATDGEAAELDALAQDEGCELPSNAYRIRCPRGHAWYIEI